MTDRYLLGVLSGYVSGESVLDGFWFILDLESKEFSYDLAIVNASAFQTNECQPEPPTGVIGDIACQ